MKNKVNSIQNITETEKIVDSKGKAWRTPKQKIIKVAEIMNNESIHPMEFSDDLYYAFDVAMTPEEIDF
ncbi:MAG: hypothetical protein FK734_11565, partial [Asgard group archaeon]|nr:hypothetical protein [Asgard group archaeon]